MRDLTDELRPVQIVVTLWMDPDADPYEVINDMDYRFDHVSILDTEIRDINTEI